MQIQSHLGLPAISSYVPAQAFCASPPAGPAPADPLDVLAAVAIAATPLATPQPVQAEDASSSATD